MKTLFLRLLLGAATLIPAAGRAEEKDPYAEIVKTYDRNGDGKLDEDEKVAAKEAMAMKDAKGPARKALEADPARRDQVLALVRTRIEESPGQLRRFDKNGNGKLDDDEWAVARAQYEAREKENAGKAAKGKAKGKLAEAGARMVEEFDQNGDGSLDASERAAMAAANRAKAEANPRVLRRFDKNRDGKLNDTEWAAARDQIGEMLEKRAK